MNQDNRLIINIITLLIILLIGMGVSNLLTNTFKQESNFSNAQNTAITTNEEITSNIDQPEEENLFIYESEQYVDAIVDDLTSSENEVNIIPRIAFIIDDLGYEIDIAKKIIEIEFPITLSILPFLKYSEYIAEEGKNSNQEIMLHLPMEPDNSSSNPGDGAITSNMFGEEIRQIVRECIFNFPHVIGVNNHMGSKITKNREIMEIVLEEIRRYDLFFIDSLTTQDSIAYQVAKEMGVKTAVRSVFLDNDSDIEYIKGQILQAQKIALRDGKAIAIGHGKINTYYVLKRMIPELVKAGIEIVPVSALVK